MGAEASCGVFGSCAALLARSHEHNNYSTIQLVCGYVRAVALLPILEEVTRRMSGKWLVVLPYKSRRAGVIVRQLEHRQRNLFSYPICKSSPPSSLSPLPVPPTRRRRRSVAMTRPRSRASSTSATPSAATPTAKRQRKLRPVPRHVLLPLRYRVLARQQPAALRRTPSLPRRVL
jgi:hypothetical protein